MTKEELEMHIIKHLILNYRLSLESASEIFKKEKNDLYCELMEIKNSIEKKAIIYVLDYETKEKELVDQKVAKRKAMIFLTRFYGAKTNQERNNILKELNENSNIESLKNKPRESITNEDINKIINFRYKYAIPVVVIAEILDITRHWIEYHESKVDENLQAKLNFLNDYHNKYHPDYPRKKH